MAFIFLSYSIVTIAHHFPSPFLFPLSQVSSSHFPICLSEPIVLLLQFFSIAHRSHPYYHLRTRALILASCFTSLVARATLMMSLTVDFDVVWLVPLVSYHWLNHLSLCELASPALLLKFSDSKILVLRWRQFFPQLVGFCLIYASWNFSGIDRWAKLLDSLWMELYVLIFLLIGWSFENLLSVVLWLRTDETALNQKIRFGFDLHFKWIWFFDFSSIQNWTNRTELWHQNWGKIHWLIIFIVPLNCKIGTHFSYIFWSFVNKL